MHIFVRLTIFSIVFLRSTYVFVLSCIFIEKSFVVLFSLRFYFMIYFTFDVLNFKKCCSYRKIKPTFLMTSAFQENEIKKLAKAGQREACTVLAKKLVQLRKQKAKSVGVSAQLSALQAQNRL